MRPRVLIPGPVLVGFNEIFEESWGDPHTPRPYPKVTPSRVGGVLLAFPCPHCNEVRSQVIDPKTRLGWHDKERDFSWCPACKGRYVINPEGRPLTKPLEADAIGAPAWVERNGETELVGINKPSGFALLGATGMVRSLRG